MDVITATATIIAQATATATATPIAPDMAASVPSGVAQLAQKMVTDAALISGGIFAAIEGFDRKVFPLPGWLKAFISWVLSGVTPYIWYALQVFQGVVPFDCYVLLLMSGIVKTGAEVLHQSTDKAPDTPLGQAVLSWWRTRRKRRTRRRKVPGGSGGAT